MTSFWPRRMMEPLPNCFSIWLTASSMAFARSRSLRSSEAMSLLVDVRCPTVLILESCRGVVKRKRHPSMVVDADNTVSCGNVSLSPHLQKCADSAPRSSLQISDFCSVQDLHDIVGHGAVACWTRARGNRGGMGNCATPGLACGGGAGRGG